MNALPLARSLQLAIDHVAGSLSRDGRHDGDRLPSLNALARSAGVSKATMWRAVKRLEEQGLVSMHHGNRLHAGRGRPPKSAPAPTVASHSQEAKRILVEQDLLRGAFAPGKPLPPVSVLQARYGASYRMMKKVLEALAADRILVAAKKKFFLPPAAATAYRNPVCLLWEGEYYSLRARPHREGRIIESLQKECSLVNSTLSFAGFQVSRAPLIDSIRSLLPRRESSPGYIIRPLAYGTPFSNEKYLELLFALSLEKKPIAILDENGTLELPAPLSSNRLIKIFRIADTSAGRDVGRMLLSLGHRKVAFISDREGVPWAERRYRGLVAEFEKAGCAGAVSLFAMEALYELSNAMLVPGEFSEAQVRRTLPEMANRGVDDDSLRQRFSFLKETFAANRKAIGKLRSNIRFLATIAAKRLHPSAREYLFNESINFVRRDLGQLAMQFLFDQAVAERACSAWVAVNDDAGVFALEYLRRRNIRVPEEISVVGFDGNPIGVEYGLTSFDFDLQNIARQMLLFVLHPSATTRFTRGGNIEMPGFIIHRNSTAKARGASR